MLTHLTKIGVYISKKIAVIGTPIILLLLLYTPQSALPVLAYEDLTDLPIQRSSGATWGETTPATKAVTAPGMNYQTALTYTGILTPSVCHFCRVGPLLDTNPPPIPATGMSQEAQTNPAINPSDVITPASTIYLPLIFRPRGPQPPTSWTTPEVLAGASIYGGAVRYPVLDVGPATISVAWFVELGGLAETLGYTDKLYGDDWSTPVEVLSIYQGRGRPTIAIDSLETVHLAARNRDKGHWAGMDYTYKPTGGTWMARYEFYTEWHVNWPVMIVDNSDTLHLVWSDIQHDPGPSKVLYASKQSGGTWSAPQEIYRNDDVTFLTTVVMDTNGTLHVAWENRKNGQWQIYYAFKPRGGGWSGPGTVPGALTYSGAGLDMAVDSNNTLHLVWADFSGSNPDIRYAMKPYGGGWTSPINLSGNPTGRYIWPTVAIDEVSNVLYAVWMEDAYESDLHYTYALPGGSWSPVTRLTTTAETFVFPEVAVDSEGDVHLVWEDYTFGIYYMKGVH